MRLENVRWGDFLRGVNQGGSRRKLLIIRDRQGSPPVPVQAGDRFRLAETRSVLANGLKQKDPDGRDQEPRQARQCEWRG